LVDRPFVRETVASYPSFAFNRAFGFAGYSTVGASIACSFVASAACRASGFETLGM